MPAMKGKRISLKTSRKSTKKTKAMSQKITCRFNPAPLIWGAIALFLVFPIAAATGWR